MTDFMGFVAGAIIALGTTTLAQGYEIKSETLARASAEARAAARIGYIRGTIAHDQTPVITMGEISDDVVRRAVEEEIDLLPTGSIRVPEKVLKPKIEWEIFDKYGRPVKRY